MKGFFDLLRDSVDVSRKSALSILALYIGMILLGILGGILSFFMIGRQIMFLLPMLQSGNFDPDILSQFAPQLAIISVMFILLMFFSFFVNFWIILVIRNNYLIGQSLLKLSFFEMLRKTPKMIFLMILGAIFFGGISGIAAFLFGRMSIIVILPFLIFCGPIFFVISYSVLCKEGNFWEIISEAISLGIRNWFRIVGYAFLFVICLMLFLAAVMLIVYALTKVSTVVGQLFSALVQFVITVFSSCFYTLFYLDIADIEPTQIEEIDVSIDPTPLQ